MVQTLFLAWQTPTRSWFPIGRLDVADSDHYLFRYTQGARDAAREAGFRPLVSFPSFDHRYESSQLFLLFKNRVLDPSRKDFAEYLGWLGLDPNNSDPIEILGLTGGERQTDSLEVFPKFVMHEDRSFSCRFFLHGLRHVLGSAREAAMQLTPGSPLQVAVELNNPMGGLAIQLQTREGHLIGWSPRYLVKDLIDIINRHPEVSAAIVRVNEFAAPLARRILIELKGQLPANYEPMTSAQFRLLVD